MRFDGLASKVQGYLPAADIDVIRRAYEFSADRHRDQKRASGEPYVSHPLAVASIIGDLRLDVPSICAGLLHDTVEDTLTTLREVEDSFGSEIATLVDGVTKISQINFRTREEHRAENIRKMIIAMSEDVRVILIKLADRTHNMRTLAGLPPDRQAKVAQETLDIFAPLAHRLGIYWMKVEMEDNALHALHPEVYYQLKRSVAKKKREREKYIREVQAVLSRALEEAGMDCDVHGRPKHFYSIYQKMRSQNLLYEQVYDLVAFRVLVDTVRECYEALGVVHGAWKPVPGRFKDYVALPKANGYQSLHTTVIGPRGERVEVQIRTNEMHRFAEEGIAAHWGHKEGGGVEREEVERLQWLRQMFEWQQEMRDPQELLHSFQEDLEPDEVYAFTPKGELLHFPAGATVIDFAYRIHSEVGHRCTGARIGSRLVPLRYALHNGDTVEIITTQHQRPSREWLKLVRTPRAKERIREWIKEEEARRSLEVGRELLGRDFEAYGLDLASLCEDGALDRVAAELGARGGEQLIAEVGYGKVLSREVVERIVPPGEAAAREPRRGRIARLIDAVSGRGAPEGLRVSGLEDPVVEIGRCCDPLPGEEILGVVSLAEGIVVHATGCGVALEADPRRRIVCSWVETSDLLRPVWLEVVGVDEPGLLAAVSKVISAAGVNIRNARSTGIEDRKAHLLFEVMVPNISGLQRVQRRISRVRGVMSVDRRTRADEA